MIHGQDYKHATLLAPQSVGTSATVSGTVDLLGFGQANIFFHCATQTAGNTHTLALSEGDTTSSYTTHADFSITTVTPSTSATQVYAWHLDTRKRKRYLKLVVTVPGTAQVGAAYALLTRPEISPDSITERGITAQAVA